MRQVKPAGSRATHGSHLPRPKILKAGVRSPDPEGHARALIRAHGLDQAAAIAANNVAFTGEDYWREVSESVSRILSASEPSH